MAADCWENVFRGFVFPEPSFNDGILNAWLCLVENQHTYAGLVIAVSVMDWHKCGVIEWCDFVGILNP